MKNTVFTGVATALITPFTDDAKHVDFDGFRKLIDFQIKGGADALVISGTTGESPVLSREEKIVLFSEAVKCSDGKIPIIAGSGSNNTEEAVRKSNDAEKQGVNGLLIVTPYYNKCTQEGLIKHYFYIADRVSAPVIIYNVPSRTGVTIKPETYKALAENKNIVAVKEASTDISSFIEAKTLCGENLCFYSGNDDLTVAMMSHGAKGVISVSSNIIPDVIHRITELCADGDFANASVLHGKYLKLMKSMFLEVNPVPVKYACSRLFGIKNRLRLPLTGINSVNAKITDSILKEYNLL